MRKLIPLVMIFLGSHAAFAAGPTQLNLAFGASVPKDPTGATLVEKDGPSRVMGGEHFLLHFAAAKTVSDIKITGYSTSKTGKALIHSATAYNGATSTSLDGLVLFGKQAAGNPTDYQNNNILPDSAFVEVMPNQPITALDIVVEGFTNNDASMLLQITSADGFPSTDFLVTRTGDTAETLGSYVNEANYAKFALADLQTLMNAAKEPAATDLAGKSYTCSSYTKLNPTQLDFKSRTYMLATNGVLLSSSDLEGQNLPWSAAPEGLELAIANYNGCGTYTTANLVRMTAGGNLIAEVELDLSAYLAQCAAAGYDGAATQAVETNSTFPSIVNPSSYVVDSFEFCHLTK